MPALPCGLVRLARRHNVCAVPPGHVLGPGRRAVRAIVPPLPARHLLQRGGCGGVLALPSRPARAPRLPAHVLRLSQRHLFQCARRGVVHAVRWPPQHP